MKIILGSTSTHKLAAIAEACENLQIEANVKGVKTDSGINEQPVRLDETFKGALTRAEGAHKQSPDSTAIGIESGIFRFGEQNSHTLDLAIVVLITEDGRKIVTTSSGVEFPQQCVEEAGRRGFDTTSVGSVVTEQFGGDPTDPHSVLTDNKVTRTMTLVDAIVVALRQI
jgi:inosine/xanthosine triphosphatase